VRPSNPSVAETFPALARICPGAEERELLEFRFVADDGLSLYTTLAAVGALSSDERVAIDDLVLAIEEALRQNIAELPRGSWASDVLSFGLATFAAEALLQRGEAVGTAVYLHRALAHPDDDGGWLGKPERLRLWHPTRDLLHVTLLEITLRYLAAAFAHGWQRAEYDDRNDALWDQTTPARSRLNDARGSCGLRTRRRRFCCVGAKCGSAQNAVGPAGSATRRESRVCPVGAAAIGCQAAVRHKKDVGQLRCVLGRPGN
jgi:hypothetical protein